MSEMALSSEPHVAARPTITWTDELKAKVRDLYATRSNSQIAAILRKEDGLMVTRNSVIGVVHRMGLRIPKVKIKSSPKPRVAKPERRPTTRIVRCNGNSTAVRIHRTTTSDLRPVRCVEVVPLHLTFDELKPSSCRYIYGETPSEYTYCGHEQIDECSWCFDHKALCFVAPKQRWA
jgi:hypothetical protein